MKLKINNKIIYKYLVFIFLICILSINEITSKTSFFISFSNLYFGKIYPTLMFFLYIVFVFDISKYYEMNYACILRYNNKKEYIDKLLKYCSFNLFLLFVISVVILFIFTIVYSFCVKNPFDINSKSIIYFVFTLYDIFKTFVIIDVILKIGIILSKLFNKQIGILFLLLVEILKTGWIYSIKIIKSFSDIPLFYGYYFIRTEYSNIFLDVFGFMLQLIILNVIFEIVKYILYNYKKIFIEG